MQSAIGIHPSGETLRIVEIVRSGEQLRVTQMQRIAIDNPNTHFSFASTNSQNGTAPACIASLPARDVLTRVWLLPNTDATRLHAMAKHRLEADLPIPIDQLVWAIRRGHIVTGQRLILAQAAKLSRTTEQLQRLTAMNLKPNILTSEHEALATLVRHGMSLTSTGALVLANQHERLVAVIDGDLVRAVRRITFPSESIELASQELRQMLTAELGADRIGQIWWVEDDSNLTEVAVIDGLLGLPVTPAKFPNLRDASGRPFNSAELVEYGPAIGLALAGLFEPTELLQLGGQAKASNVRHGRIHRLLEHPYRLTIAACLLFLLALGTHVGAMRFETARMNRELAALTVSTAADLDQKVRAMQRLERYRLDVEGIVSEICRTIPDPVIVSSVQLSRERRLIIKGTSKDPKAVFTFADALRKSPRFIAVNPERSAPSQGGDFTVSAELTGIEKFAAATGRGGTWR